jgi:formyltetrahydrofolate-dependent phosphoribosylglycinamide formyltransferase
MKVAVFASGSGTDFLSLVKASQERKLGWEVVLLITNNPDAGAIEKAKAHNIPFKFINRQDFEDGKDFLSSILKALNDHQADFIALAGYLRKIPPGLIRKFTNRIINIHPALLPSFGGKGMYGEKVHQAVLDTGCKISGCTIHLVNEEYDRGAIVAQRAVPVMDDDTAETLGKRILKQEHLLYPEVVTWFAQNRVKIEGMRTKIIGRNE